LLERIEQNRTAEADSDGIRHRKSMPEQRESTDTGKIVKRIAEHIPTFEIHGRTIENDSKEKD
jgi:hypothetical protein